MSEEETNVRREWGGNRYHNMFEEKKKIKLISKKAIVKLMIVILIVY